MTIHPTTIRPALTPAEQRYLDLYASVADRLPGARHARVREWREAALDLVRLARPAAPPRRGMEIYGPSRADAGGPSARGAFAGGGGGCQLRGRDWQGAGRSGRLPRRVRGRAVPAGPFERAGCAWGDIRTAPRRARRGFGPAPRSRTQAEAGRDAIAALAAAFATDGALLSVAPKTRLEKPIHFIFIASEGRAEACRHAKRGCDWRWRGSPARRNPCGFGRVPGAGVHPAYGWARCPPEPCPR